jgi:hypothetical protein
MTVNLMGKSFLETEHYFHLIYFQFSHKIISLGFHFKLEVLRQLKKVFRNSDFILL